MLQAPILSPCHVSPWFGLEGEVLGLGLGLAGQVLVNITVLVFSFKDGWTVSTVSLDASVDLVPMCKLSCRRGIARRCMFLPLVDWQSLCAEFERCLAVAVPKI